MKMSFLHNKKYDAIGEKTNSLLHFDIGGCEDIPTVREA